MNQLKVMWTITKKDLSIWGRTPSTIIVTIISALVLLLVIVLVAAAVSGSPVAIVNQDNEGATTQKFVQIAENYDGFYRATIMTPDEAAKAYETLQGAGILTIPPNFSTDIVAGRKLVIEWQVRNFNDDTANDLRRALPDVIDEFVKKSGAGGSNLIYTTIDEQDLHKTDASYVGFQLLAILVVLIIQSGIVNAGLASVREWESKTIKELLMSPASSLAIIAGKVLTGVIASDIAGCIVLAIGLILGVIPNVTLTSVILALLMMTLVGIFGSGIGVLLAAILRTTERGSAVSVVIAFYLFFLAGGISDITYLPNWLHSIALFIPNTYSVKALRSASI